MLNRIMIEHDPIIYEYSFYFCVRMFHFLSRHHSTVIHSRLQMMARQQTLEHRRAMWMWFAALPIIMPIGILPIPNLPFYWNVYRIYCNWRAAKGGEELDRLLEGQCKSRTCLNNSNHEENEPADVQESKNSSERLNCDSSSCVGSKCCLLELESNPEDVKTLQNNFSKITENGNRGFRGIKLVACEWLDTVVKPRERMQSMLSNARAGIVSRQFALASIDETLVRLRNAVEQKLHDKQREPEL